MQRKNNGWDRFVAEVLQLYYDLCEKFTSDTVKALNVRTQETYMLSIYHSVFNCM